MNLWFGVFVAGLATPVVCYCLSKIYGNSQVLFYIVLYTLFLGPVWIYAPTVFRSCVIFMSSVVLTPSLCVGIERSNLVLPLNISAKDLCHLLECLWCTLFGTSLIFSSTKWEFFTAIHTCSVLCWILFFHFDINPFASNYTVDTSVETIPRSLSPVPMSFLPPRNDDIPQDPPPLYPTLLESKYDWVVDPPSVYE